MLKFCTECGSKLANGYKFCPDCGAKIIPSVDNNLSRLKQSNQNNQTSKAVSQIIICDNCGEENSIDNVICDGCGIKLKGTISKKIIPPVKDDDTEHHTKHSGKTSKQQNIKNKKHKKETHKKTGSIKEEKQLDSKIIFIISAAIGGILIIVLISFGALDSSGTVVPGNNTGSNQSTGSGIDLSNIGLINDLEKQLQADPGNKEILIQLANLKNDSGFNEQAIPLYRRYLEIVPEDPDARIDMGVCMYNVGDFENAIKEMKKALEYKPDHQIGHLNLGVVNLTFGNVDEARTWFELAVKLGPTTEVGKRAKELLNSHKL